MKRISLKKMNIKLGKKGYIICGAVLGLCVLLGLVMALLPKKDADIPVYEPAPPEAPRLTSLGVIGEKIEFSKEVRYYEVEVPQGNPVVPEVWATAVSDVNIEIYQGYFAEGSDKASARVYLDDGKHKNSYEIRFVKKKSQGIVLQYDDVYVLEPAYKLRSGEQFVFSVNSPDGNVIVDQDGTVKAVGISENESVVTVTVGQKTVDTFKIKKTVKAVLNVFIIAGQGNASGEGGNPEECVAIAGGKAYNVEIGGDNEAITDLTYGRKGLTPALAEKWYSLTSEKTLFIQSAVPNSSVKDWMTDGKAYISASKGISAYIDSLKTEDSKFALKKVYCIWLQGEWDVAAEMTSMEYVKSFKEFEQNLKGLVDLEMIGVIPVRTVSVSNVSSGKANDVWAAQYSLCSMYDDIRLITRLPETATVEDGLVAPDELYYTQKGYNELGQDIAYNLYNCYSSETDKSIKAIDVYSAFDKSEIEHGKEITLKEKETIKAVPVITPLYSKNNCIETVYDESLIKYTDYGELGRADTNTEYEGGEIVFKGGDMEFTLNLSFEKGGEGETDKTVYEWSFDDLYEKNRKNDLTASERSDISKYSIEDGVLQLSERMVDFSLKNKVTLTCDVDWDIEWKGSVEDNSILIGGEYSTTGYILLAPYAENLGYSIRVVDDMGKAYYLPYNDRASMNGSVNEWKVSYSTTTRTLTLYSNGNIVSLVRVNEDFSLSFTNLLGRYGSEDVNYCYIGKLDRMKISFGGTEPKE